MKRPTLVFLLLGLTAADAFAVGSLGIDGAPKRCPAWDTGCNLSNAPESIRDRINDASESVREKSSQRDFRGACNEIWNAFKDVGKCAGDAIDVRKDE